MNVPRDALPSGITTCVAASALGLEGAEALLQCGLITHAAVLLSFATEEFGKAVMLRAAYVGGAPSLSRRQFTDHQTKLDTAADFIGRERLSWHRRLANLHVDWRDNRWSFNDAALNADDVRDGIEAVQAAIYRTSMEWPE